ncbi:hypothetical protein TWF217_002757 [Orbilia oligospora]|nr:hypothetical protein TWF217_002757 [Orbilia oligospora]
MCYRLRRHSLGTRQLSSGGYQCISRYCHGTGNHQYNDGAIPFQGLVNHYGGMSDVVSPSLEQSNNNTAIQSAYAYRNQFIEPDTATGPNFDVSLDPNLWPLVLSPYEVPSHQHFDAASQAVDVQPADLQFHLHEEFPTQDITTQNSPDGSVLGSELENTGAFELTNAILDARPSGANRDRIHINELANLISQLSMVVPLPSLRPPRGLQKGIRHNQPQSPASPGAGNSHPGAQPLCDQDLYVACCLHPYCLSHIWSTSGNKAKDNLYQTHQRRRHSEWAKDTPVKERCTLLGPYSKTVLRLRSLS